MQVTSFAPASIGNISVGFDVLGAAVAPIDGTKLGDTVTVRSSDEYSFEMTGPWCSKLADLKESGKKNLVQACAEYFLEQLPEDKRKTFKIELFKNMPVGSGLGSSASSVVAAFSSLNQFFAKPFDDKELLLMMGKLEGSVSGSVHYDNVAPAFLGGIQLMSLTQSRICVSVPHFENWYWVLAYPGISLATSEMRALLPQKYERSTTIEYGRNLATFVQASFTKNEKLAIEVLKDVLAEPYRKSKIPGFEEAVKQMSEIGMLVSGISGSGPTMFSVTDSLEKAKEAKKILKRNYVQNSEGFVHICQIK
ncbi:MAG: homoserine kinase [Candidatus Riflebacteria bacterium]|nr:homoserine kinase [Candidatus Riflebacteria bacterium]